MGSWLIVEGLRLKINSGMVLTCVTVHSHTHGNFIVLPHWKIMPLAPWPNQTQFHYPDTELTSPCSILLMLNTKQGSNNYQFDKSLAWLDQEWIPKSPTRDAPYSTNSATMSSMPMSRVWIDLMTWSENKTANIGYIMDISRKGELLCKLVFLTQCQCSCQALTLW